MPRSGRVITQEDGTGPVETAGAHPTARGAGSFCLCSRAGVCVCASLCLCVVVFVCVFASVFVYACLCWLAGWLASFLSCLLACSFIRSYVQLVQCICVCCRSTRVYLRISVAHGSLMFCFRAKLQGNACIACYCALVCVGLAAVAFPGFLFCIIKGHIVLHALGLGFRGPGNAASSDVPYRLKGLVLRHQHRGLLHRPAVSLLV